VLRPVRELGRASRLPGEGELRTRIAVRGSDELADVARTFNNTAAELERHVKQLREMEADGVQRAFAFFTSPFSSYSGCRQSRENLFVAPEEVGEHPQRSIVTRVLGPEALVRIDTHTFAARAGDVFLLCSDGLTTMIGEPQVAATLSAAPGARAAGALGDQATAIGWLRAAAEAGTSPLGLASIIDGSPELIGVRQHPEVVSIRRSLAPTPAA